MKSWIKRSLIGLAAATVVLGGLTACGSRGDHARGWSDERQFLWQVLVAGTTAGNAGERP